MKPIIFSLFNNDFFADAIKKYCDYEIGEMVLHQFPDEETYIKINSDIRNRKVVFVGSLDYPNEKLLPLLFAAKTARDLEAKEIGLVAPYLAYMRQDKQFNPGEGVTSKYFASLLSQYFDWLITVDPHLHRLHSLNEIYSIPTFVLHAIDPIADWIKNHVEKPILIGPDKESEQWVANIAQKANAPFTVLEKIRISDRMVEVSLPQIEQYKNHIPVLIDDIISTARTMIETLKHLKNLQMKPPICIGVHAVFAGNSYEDLLAAGASKVVTCNTIKHVSNMIDLSDVITNALKKFRSQ